MVNHICSYFFRLTIYVLVVGYCQEHISLNQKKAAVTGLKSVYILVVLQDPSSKSLSLPVMNIAFTAS